MSTYKTARGKLVAYGGISLAVHENGSLMIRIGDNRMDLTEDEASRLHDLMSDVLEWQSNAGTTEGKFEKMSDAEDADVDSGRAEDERAHQGR